jgi:hypothetical protein
MKKTCTCCKLVQEIPFTARILRDDSLAGAYWECDNEECGSTLFVPMKKILQERVVSSRRASSEGAEGLGGRSNDAPLIP